MSRQNPHLASRFSIVCSLIVGLVLVVAPWWASLWEENWILPPWPTLRAVVLSGFVRGAVSGLGLVNVLVALADLRTRLMDLTQSD